MIDGYIIFDAHMHYKGKFMGKNQTIIEYMDENRIDCAVLNTINTQVAAGRLGGSLTDLYKSRVLDPNFEFFEKFRKNGQPSHEIVRDLANKFPNRIFPFFWYNPVDPQDPTQENGIEMIKDAFDNNSFKGVKLQLSMTPCKIERLFPIIKVLVEYDLPIFIHPSAGIFSAPRTTPIFIIKLAEKFPNLKIIVGHSSYTMEFCVELTTLLKVKGNISNIYFETSVSITYGILFFINTFGAKRVIFGSDSPTAGPFHHEYNKIAFFKIPKEDKELILSKNIKHLLNI